MTHAANNLWNSSLVHFFKDIKLAHSIFALPFVLSALIFIDFKWDPMSFLFIVLCMVSARSFAMGMNRFLDREIDQRNPRTKQRMIPNGTLAADKGLFWSLCFGFAFVFFSFQLSSTAGFCSPFVLLILGLYPYMKKVSWLTHWYLGLCLGLSPLAASVALSGGSKMEILLLALAIAMWTAGFDILYSLQDYAFDRTHSLKSVPARFGVRNSLFLSRFSFFVMITLLFYIGLLRGSSMVYFIGVVIISGILIWEQWIVRSSNEKSISSNIGIAFFNANACVGIIFFIFTLFDKYLTQ